MTQAASGCSGSDSELRQSLTDALKDGWNSWRYRVQVRSQGRPLRLRRSQTVWLLGREYRVAEDTADRLICEFRRAMYLSYRREIQPPLVSALTGRVYGTDAGWGCMYRCAQMLAAAALMRHRLGAAQIGSPEAAQLRELFDDAGSLSLSALVAACGRQPGDWVGPATACQALVTTVAACEPGLRVHVAANCCVCRDQLLAALQDLPAAGHRQQRPALLLLLPLRLGGGSLAHGQHLPALQAMLRQPSCVGLLGGRPRRSVYFYGYQGDRLLGMDPHRCLRDWRVHLHSGKPRLIAYRQLDPSCAAGFLLSSGAPSELDQLLACMANDCRGLACVVQSSSEIWPAHGGGATVTSIVSFGDDPGDCLDDIDDGEDALDDAASEVDDFVLV